MFTFIYRKIECNFKTKKGQRGEIQGLEMNRVLPVKFLSAECSCMDILSHSDMSFRSGALLGQRLSEINKMIKANPATQPY